MPSGCFETEQELAPLPDHFVVRYVTCLKGRYRSMLASWAFISVGLFSVGVTRLMDMTRNQFDPPQGSASRTARELMTHHFPGSNARHTDIVYFEVAKGYSVLHGGLLRSVTQAVDNELRDLLVWDLYSTLSITGYVSAVAHGLPSSAARAQFVSDDNSSSFLVMQYPKIHTMKYGQALQECLLRLRSHQAPAWDKISFLGGGGNALQSVEAVEAGVKTIGRMDFVSVPVSFVIFGFSLKSIRFLMLPLLTLVVGYITAFGIMGLLACTGSSVSSATPPLMMSMLLAVSIDYALFLLTRFKEEIDAGASTEAAVTQMLMHSGHTVCGSGFTLAFCFVALLFFPVHLMQSIGIGVIVSIVSAILVSLTLIPATILACPKFFASYSKSILECQCCHRSISDTDHAVSPLTNGVDRSHSLPPRGFETTKWFRWSLFATSREAAVLSLSIILIIGGLSVIRCEHMRHSMDTWLMAPRVSISLDTFQHFSRSFSVGSTAPFQLLLLPDFSDSSTCSSPTGGTGFYSEAFWTNATALLEGLTAELYDSNSGLGDSVTTAPGMMHSIMYLYNVPTGFQSSPASAFSVPMEFALFLDPKAPVHAGSKSICNSWGMFLKGQQRACHHFLATKRCEDLVPLAPLFAQYLNMSKAAVPNACMAFQSELKSSATSARDAVFATLVPAVLDRSRESVQWTRRCRKFLRVKAEKYPCLKAHLNGMTPQMVDAIDSIYGRVPNVLAITMCVCLLFVSFLTVSLAFGVSAVVLIGWTLLVVFAIGDVVYRGNVLEAITGSAAVVRGTDGLAWIVAPLTFSMIFGLGLDYNIFLLGRVCEYHCAGFSDREALAYGVAKTGPVINSAGLIMAVAFSGMMLSSIPMLNQVGFLLVVAVLIDTFFVRCLATPALHAPLKWWNWWPRRASGR